MKKLVIHPVKALRGTLEIPGDKSVSHRSIILGSLATGTTRIRHFLASEDCLATLKIFQSMGVSIKRSGDRVTIQGKGLNSLKPSRKILDAGNSGTTARILLGLLAGQPFKSRLTGDESLRKRPMRRVVEPLLKMGARVTGPNEANFLPLELETRRLHGIKYRLPVASAQVKSALLLAGLFAEGTTTVEEPIATRDHTERMFSSFSIPFLRKGTSITVKGPAAPFRGCEIQVPGDISSAAFFITAALLAPGPGVLLRNVGMNPTRTGFLEVLARMGAKIQFRRKAMKKGAEPVGDLFIRPSKLKAVRVDGEVVPRMIDEFPVFAVAATQARGTTVVRNAEDLKVKESDRILMMSITLRKMGANIEPKDDGWIIQGPTPLRGNSFSSGGDHRVAMSLAVAGLIAEGPTTILDTENIDTSFPEFEGYLEKISVF